MNYKYYYVIQISDTRGNLIPYRRTITRIYDEDPRDQTYKDKIVGYNVHRKLATILIKRKQGYVFQGVSGRIYLIKPKL